MKDKLKRIELETTLQSAASNEKKKHISWKKAGIPLGILCIASIFLFIVSFPLMNIVQKAQYVAYIGKETMNTIKSQDLEKTKQNLQEIRKGMNDLEKEYGKILPMKHIPVFGVYVSDGEHAIRASFAAITAGEKTVEALEPNADLLGLKGKTNFLSGSAEDRLQMAVKTMSALTPNINEVASSIETMRNELQAIDPNRYPERIHTLIIRSRLITAKQVIEDTANLFVHAQPLLTSLPKLLGEPTEKRYLILFQNDKELRATGGFITAYAQFRMARGKPILEKSDDIYALDASLQKKFPAPKEILTFHKGVYTFNLRDSNLSPDFKISMQQFEEMYKETSGKEKIDGIIAVDTHVLVEALKILGPMNIYGREFSAVVDTRCDCPKAIYELEDYATRPVNYVREARKDIIGVLLQRILQMALGVSPSKYWGSLFQMLISEINQKHIIAYIHDDAGQKAVESFNMAGRIMTKGGTSPLLKYKEGEGWDYLHINNSNMAGAKANMFVNEKVIKDVTFNTDGVVTTKLTIDYKNPYPGSDCGLESGGLCLNAPLRNWIRIYVPIGSKLIESKGAQSPKDGKPITLDTYQSLEKTVFEGFLIVNPLGTAKLEIVYSTPLTTESGYRLLIQKQPGTNTIEYTIKLNGKERKKFQLLGDSEIQL